MSKIIVYDNDAKQKILNGINKLEKCVSSTLGPMGRNVIIDNYGSVHSTKDGVTVAKNIFLKDPFENIGVNAVKEVAEKSNKNVGDGTTTATVLAAEIFRSGLKYVSVGSNATQIRTGIKKAADCAIDFIKSVAKPISTKEDIKRVCTVSANGDEKIGEMIADVMDKIGNDGTIKVEDSKTLDMTSKIVEGMVLDVGYVSPYMITKQETMEADLSEPFILLANKNLSNMQDLLPCLQSISQTGRPLVIIADDFQDDIIGTVIFNKMRSNGNLNVVLVKSPSFGDNRKDIMEDIAISTNGSVVSDDLGTKLESAIVGSPILGQAKRVLINKDTTIIFDGYGDKRMIEARAAQIRKQIEDSTSEYDISKLRERLAKLVSGVGVILVGADTDAERKELRDRVDDAFCAAKAAVKSGIVPGGGTILLRAIDKVRQFAVSLSNDERIGAAIFANALSAPAKKIVENAGLDASYIVNKVMEDTTNVNYGYDALNRKYVDMLEAGIIDPVDVVINEVKNASSISGLLLTTECLIADEPEEKSNVSQPMMPMM